MTENDIAAARARMIAKRFGGAAPTTGGKGTARRKKKIVSRSSSAQSDAKLNGTLKKLGATNIPGIEEIHFFMEDGNVLLFKNPKLQAAIAANTYSVSGPCETKSLQEILPQLVSQMGINEMSQFAAAQAGLSSATAGIPEGNEEEDDDDVPDLVDGNFEEVSEK